MPQGQGGALSAMFSSLMVDSSTFLNNTASIGGAIYAREKIRLWPKA
jgi:predicted outer membrane repeat protein